MSERSWPPRPSQSASTAHALCVALADLLHEGGSRMDRRTYIKVCGLVTAVEVFSQEAARWYFNRMGEDHDLLDALEDRYVDEAESD